ncbi:TonB-dependent receptor [Pseudorhodoferax sp.]|uniref:TonB-dependent receptor n=1 Tax=Pseudorhodoferax sp. TaxID=1993553 RepID=UPI002DD6227F|nr:TonB-dependent receptor [Pseudorhodoferax sp.]
MKINQSFKIKALALTASLLCASLSVPSAHAQLSTATIRGVVSAAGKSLPAGLEVVAVNAATGAAARTKTRADGDYILVGLAPGTYRIRVVGNGIDQQVDEVVVQVGESTDLNIALANVPGAEAKSLEKVVITGSATRGDVKSSSVGTSVTTRQIEALPQSSRNFLAFADLAPGVRFETDAASGQSSLKGGAQSQDNVNVFIDGVSQKNYILRGGISGMDSTRGNPFPQSAVQEYKVVSQNYKAEFDQVSSTAITAVTKSGTNEFHGDVFVDRTGTSFTARTPFQKKAEEEEGVKRPKTTSTQYGFSMGGAVKEDVLHYFLAYEGKKIDSPRTVTARNLNQFSDLGAGVIPDIVALQGGAVSSFKEDLLLAKIDATISSEHKLTFTGRLRNESDLIPEDVNISSAENVKDRINDERRLEVKHEWRTDNWLNEARIGFEDYKWNPHSRSSDPMIKYVVSPSNNQNNIQDVLFTGGSPDAQNRRQRAFLFQNDFSLNLIPNHAIKMGFKFKAAKFDMSGTSRSVDVLNTLVNNTTGEATVFRTDAAILPASVSLKDNQYGIYVQDDWRVNKNLELNLGVRWDYEDNMLNNDYVTPADRVAIFGAQDPRAGAAPGQTYAQSLAKGGININNFISDGNSRKSYTGAIQPRVGFSYDINGDAQSVIFSGFGRAYDRTIANTMLDEAQKNASAGGEIWMVRNNGKMPFTDQFALGLRQKVATWNTEVGATYSHAKNQFIWYGGNRDVNGGTAGASPIDPLWGSVPGFGTLVLGDFVGETKTKTVYLKADKPFTKASGWAASITYTYSQGETTNKEWTNDVFNWTYGRSTAGWNPSKDVEKHRIVAAGLVDGFLPWGLLLSGKVTLGSGLPRRLTDCTNGFTQCVSTEGKGSSFRQFDVAVGKEIKVGYGKFVVRADILNLFNTVNYGGRDDWIGGPGNPQNAYGGDNKNLNTPNGMAGPMRTFKMSLAYRW